MWAETTRLDQFMTQVKVQTYNMDHKTLREEDQTNVHAHILHTSKIT